MGAERISRMNTIDVNSSNSQIAKFFDITSDKGSLEGRWIVARIGVGDLRFPNFTTAKQAAAMRHPTPTRIVIDRVG